MYRLGQATETTLSAAVTRGWITEEQKQEIIDTGGNVGVLTATVTT